jgi:hypothetical protein
MCDCEDSRSNANNVNKIFYMFRLLNVQGGSNKAEIAGHITLQTPVNPISAHITC